MGSWARTGVSAFAQVTKRILQTQEGHLQGAITQSGRRGFASGALRVEPKETELLELYLSASPKESD